jgi:hypothetical protein
MTDSKYPHAYLMHKLGMIIPLFQEARDALPTITEIQRIRAGIPADLADRMDAAGTYSLEDWKKELQQEN